jgi:thiol-disulfide isomerase/thioredoxin
VLVLVGVCAAAVTLAVGSDPSRSGGSGSGAMSGGGEAIAVHALPAGTRAPRVTLPTLSGANGDRGLSAVHIPGAGGRPELIDFFASWCGGCRADLRAVASASRLYAGRLRVVGVDVNDEASAADSLLAADHAEFPVGVDPASTTAGARYHLVGLPDLVVVDRQGRVVETLLGPVSAAQLRSLARSLSG